MVNYALWVALRRCILFMHGACHLGINFLQMAVNCIEAACPPLLYVIIFALQCHNVFKNFSHLEEQKC